MIKLLVFVLLMLEMFALFDMALSERQNPEQKKNLPNNSEKPNNKKSIENLMKNLYNANSMADLAKLGVVINGKKAEMRMGPVIGRSSYNANNDMAAAIMEEVKDATPGKCDPKPVCISNPLTLNITSTQFAFPPCINIHRCDGCCPTNEKCVAIRSHEVRLQKVGIINFEGESEPKYDETFVTVLNHTECQCQCQWETDDDCKTLNPNFVRNSQACECICPEELSCGPLHEFDRELCSCKCRKSAFYNLEKNCRFRGFNWSDTYCKCEAVKSSVNQKEIRIIGQA